MILKFYDLLNWELRDFCLTKSFTTIQLSLAWKSAEKYWKMCQAKIAQSTFLLWTDNGNVLLWPFVSVLKFLFYPKAVSKIADGVTGRWQQLVTRAEERHKLVTASLNFYKTAEQVRNNHFVFTENLGENFDISRFRFTATGADSVRAFKKNSRQITTLSYLVTRAEEKAQIGHSQPQLL